MSALTEKLEAFPILDSLQREENPIGPPWAKPTRGQNTGKLTPTGYVTTTAKQFAIATRAASPVPAGCGVELGTLTSGSQGVGLILAEADNKNYLWAFLFENKKLHFGKTIEGTSTEKGSAEKTFSATDLFFLSFNPNETNGWKLLRKPAAGAMEVLKEIATESLPTLGSAAGVEGEGSSESVAYRLKNFRAGSLAGGLLPILV